MVTLHKYTYLNSGLPCQVPAPDNPAVAGYPGVLRYLPGPQPDRGRGGGLVHLNHHHCSASKFKLAVVNISFQ